MSPRTSLPMGAMLLLLAACGGPADEAGVPEDPVALPERPVALFRDVAPETGLDFVHFNGMSGDYYMVEMMGPGGALFDYDNDGDLDAYLVQGTMLGEDRRPDEATFPPRHPLPLTNRLYRNDLGSRDGGRAVLRFTDVTDDMGVAASDYGMGVAAGDFDNDGWTDLYLTNFGPNRLLRNRGDGTFDDVTESTGVADRRWSVSATFLDFDGDGWLDLYVGNYLDFTLGGHKICHDASGAQDWCGPAAYNGVPDRLFRNLGDGTFDDVSVSSGVGRPPGKSMGVVASDLDGNGRLDLYVTNDGEPNHLWLQQEDGTFREDALIAGCAINADGRPEASMGVAAGDFDNDGDEDLFMTHLTGETNTLFVNQGGVFTDRTRQAGLDRPSLKSTGFGTRWVDLDRDGWLDLVVLNGAVHTIQELAQTGDPFPLGQRRQMFHNQGDGTLREIGERGGTAFGEIEVGRGAAFGDVDNDGDVDILVVNNNAPARLFLYSDPAEPNRWLGLDARTAGGRPALGATLVVDRGDGSIQRRACAADGSYASSSDPRVLFGLGLDRSVEEIRVRWADGATESWTGLETERYHRLTRGTGKATSGSSP